jgi:hypothetical protein
LLRSQRDHRKRSRYADGCHKLNQPVASPSIVHLEILHELCLAKT